METNELLKLISVVDPEAWYLLAGWGVSEILPFMKKRKSNGVIGLVWNVGKAVLEFWKGAKVTEAKKA